MILPQCNCYSLMFIFCVTVFCLGKFGRLLCHLINGVFFGTTTNGDEWIKQNFDTQRIDSSWPHHWKDIFKTTIHVLWMDHTDRLYRNRQPFSYHILVERSLRVVQDTLFIRL